jgi:multidrug efflux pump subunit AcrA (membrane-fusion protein)
MSSLNRMKAEVAQVRALRMLSTNDVHIVKVQSMAGTDTAALNSALSKNAADVAALRSALSRLQLTASTDRHTLTFAQFLADNKLSINQVVAADVSNGALTAFIQ